MQHQQTQPQQVGHEERFLRCFTMNEAAIRAFVRSLLPSREDAAEVMQEVSVVLWRKFEGLSSEADFRRWAFGVARYEVLAYARDKARDRLVFSEDVATMLADQAADEADTLEAQREALETCLEKLATRERQLVDAAYAPGTRIDHLAHELGRTPMSLYKALHRIRLSLLECVRRLLRQEQQA